MRLIRAICRFIFGMTFILSGIFKALDPVGVSLKIDEYFAAFHLSFLSFSSDFFAIMLPLVEFVVGVSVLKGLKINIFSRIALALVSFFTLLTLFIALFDPIKDCGCFGDAIGFSNWESFIKNIILLIAALVVYYGRDKVKQIARETTQWVYIGLYSIIILGIACYSFFTVPFIDFGMYCAGTDLVDVTSNQQEREYQTTFIYEKEGVEEEFTLDNLPDSSWVYVDTKTILLSGEEDEYVVDFAVKDLYGNYVSEELITDSDPVFVFSYYEDEPVTSQDSLDLISYSQYLRAYGAKLYVLTVSPDYNVSKILPDNTVYGDFRTIISFNRSNGGLTYIKDGLIVHKWANSNYPFEVDRILEADYELITLMSVMKERVLFLGIFVIVFFLIVIVRSISLVIFRIIQKRKDLLQKKKVDP